MSAFGGNTLLYQDRARRMGGARSAQPIGTESKLCVIYDGVLRYAQSYAEEGMA